MSEGGPTTGEVKVTLKLDTEDAKSKVAEVERKLKANEQERSNLTRRIDKEGFGAKSGGGKMGQTIADKMLQRILPKTTGNPQINTSVIGQFAQGFNRGFRGVPQPGTNNQAGGNINLANTVGNILGQAGGFVNPFPTGGVSGGNANGGPGSTIALAKSLYNNLQKAAKFSGLALAYKMKSGQASVKTPEGEFFNELNSTFSYINNYTGSYRDAADRLVKWDDAVSAVTGRLPDTQFYLPKFQRQALFERQFIDMVSRNAALTRAGARGASSLTDQLGDAAAQSMSR